MPNDVFNHAIRVTFVGSILNGGGCFKNEKFCNSQKAVLTSV